MCVIVLFLALHPPARLLALGLRMIAASERSCRHSAFVLFLFSGSSDYVLDNCGFVKEPAFVTCKTMQTIVRILLLGAFASAMRLTVTQLLIQRKGIRSGAVVYLPALRHPGEACP